jgi:hypothetical protein
MMAMDFNRSEKLELSLYSQGFRSTEKIIQMSTVKGQTSKTNFKRE